MSNEKGPAVGLTFIDILFAVVVGVGLTDVTGRAWVTNFLGNLGDPELWAFILGNTVVVASWVGYHKMMAGQSGPDAEASPKPLDPELRTPQGVVRFIIDVVLLFLYYRLLVRTDYPLLVLSLVCWVFVLYVLWDCVVITEQAIGKRGGVTLIWTALLFLVYLAGRYCLPMTNRVGWICLYICGTLFAWGYRYHKWHKLLIDPLAVWLSRGQEFMLGRLRKRSDRGMRVYVAGPYTASSEDEILRNVQTAIDAALEIYSKGHRPYVPHLTHYIDKRAKEIGLEISREDFVRRWDAPWLALCDALLYLADSPGAREELEAAQGAGMKVFYDGASIPKAHAE